MSKIDQFNPSRLTFARKRRGMTKSKLASLIGVDLRSVTAYEKGEFNPDPESRDRIAKALRFPVEFFDGEDLEELSPDSTSFRAMSKMTAAQRDMALGAGAIALLVNKWIRDRFELPCTDLPDLSHEGNTEVAADSLRRYWGLGELPIKNMAHLLESKGVQLFSISIDAREVDAFSMWRNESPFIFLNTKKSAERSRFDSAHELGHLVIHRHGGPQGIIAEREANTFASAFLMPRSSILAKAPRVQTVDQLIKLKAYWGVSVAALAYRMHGLGLITDWNYRTICVQITARKYHINEPRPLPRETSQLLSKVFKALREDNVPKENIANDLHVSKEEIDQLAFGLTMIGLPGASLPNRSANPKRDYLRLIDSENK